MSRTEYEKSSSTFEKCTKYSTGCMFIVGPSAMLELSPQNIARRRLGVSTQGTIAGASVLAQRGREVDPRCSARRQIGSQQRHAEHRQRNEQEHRRIERADAVELARDDLSQRDRAHEADADAEAGEPQRASQEHIEDAPAIR